MYDKQNLSAINPVKHNFIEIQRLQLDNFSRAFNASSLLSPEGRIMFFRIDENSTGWCFSDLRIGNRTNLSCNVDPKLIRHNNKIYMSTSYFDSGNFYNERVELREITKINNNICDFEIIGKFDSINGMKKNNREKNWVMFSYENDLYYVQSVDPHNILKVDFKFGSVSLVYTSQCNNIAKFLNISNSSILRLNACPVLTDEGFLSVGHIRNGHDEYYSFFYLFENKPPFKIIKVTQLDFLGAQYSLGKKPINNCRLLFFNSMELIGDCVCLWGGEDDNWIVRVHVPLREVMNHLRNVD